MLDGRLRVRTVLVTDPDVADLPSRAAELMGRAYGRAPFHRSLRRILAVQPDGLAVVEDRGRLVATGCFMAYPSGGFGWVGLVATEPGDERRGAGRLVTAHLVERLLVHGCASVLDASLKGAPVYERMGFVDHGLTTVMVAPSLDQPRLDLDDDDRSIVLLDETGLDALDRYDARRFGASRRALLINLIHANPGRAWTCLDRERRPTGYVVAGVESIGPLVADDAPSVTALARAALALAWVEPPTMCVPPGSRHVDALRTIGFRPLRQLRRMHLGVAMLPGERSALAAGTSLGEG